MITRTTNPALGRRPLTRLGERRHEPGRFDTGATVEPNVFLAEEEEEAAPSP